MNYIKQWIKVFTFLLLSSLFGTTALQAVGITLDGTITKINGDGNLATCNTGDTYRLGTTATYNGQTLDVLLTITDTDNEYPLINQNAGDCISVNSGILETRLRDRSGISGSGSDADTRAFMDLHLSLVQQGTTTPVEVDRIVFTAFDLDTNNQTNTTATNYTGTDDIYMISPNQGYLQANAATNVSYSEGDFGAGFNVKLKGQTTGDCQDSPTNPDPTCRGGGVAVIGDNGPNLVSSMNLRVSNDNAYGQIAATTSYRLMQISLKESDFQAILNDSADHGDAPSSYGDASNNVDIGTILGYGYPADNEAAQYSVNADADDLNPANENFDDEDGVRIGNQPTLSSELNMTVGFDYDLNVTTIGNGYLNAWIDLNGDGDFADAGEHLLTDQALSSVVAIKTIIPVSVPSNNYVGQSYVRFRFSQNAGVGSSGAGGKGEVEDYTVFFNPSGDISGHLYSDTNKNGTQDAGEPDMAGVDVVITAANGEVQTVTTDANGDYLVSAVAVGNATVDIDDTTLPAGAVQTEGTDPTTVMVNAGANNFEENNGFEFAPSVFIKTSSPENTPLLAGDTVDYNLTFINNLASTTLTNVVIDDPIPTGATYVGGSGQITYFTRTQNSYLFADNMTRSADKTGYQNNDGNVSFSSDWIETGDGNNNDPDGGKIQINNKFMTGSSNNEALEINLDAPENASIQRELDLSSYVSASLSFDYGTDDQDNTDSILILEASSGGVNFTPLETFTVTSDNNTYSTKTYDLTPYISATTTIRFRVGAVHKKDRVYIDDVKIIANQEIYTPVTEAVDIVNDLANNSYTSYPKHDINVNFQTTVNNNVSVNEINNTATLNADGIAQKTASTSDPVMNDADLSVVKTLLTPPPFVPGQSISYSIVVSNAGPLTATDINVTDLPTNLEVTSATGSTSVCSITPASGVTTSVYCTISSLAVDANETITIQATVP